MLPIVWYIAGAASTFPPPYRASAAAAATHTTPPLPVATVPNTPNSAATAAGTVGATRTFPATSIHGDTATLMGTHHQVGMLMQLHSGVTKKATCPFSMGTQADGSSGALVRGTIHTVHGTAKPCHTHIHLQRRQRVRIIIMAVREVRRPTQHTTGAARDFSDAAHILFTTFVKVHAARLRSMFSDARGSNSQNSSILNLPLHDSSRNFGASSGCSSGCELRSGANIRRCSAARPSATSFASFVFLSVVCSPPLSFR